MDSHQQLQLRIRAFLNASDLTDSNTARELYQAYREENNAAARRLLECESLINKKQKIEAVLLAQHEPKLFDVIDSLLFPERDFLLKLADLYDWPILDSLNVETIETVKAAVAGMEDLRPLLTEFRRIARTELVEDKLHLLREIYRIDHENPEWRLSLGEVENQYLSKLISEAQESIQKKNFSRLEEIHNELHKSQWIVAIPSIVLQKIDKLVAAHRLEQDKLQAMKLLDKIATAYGAFDVVALEDAILCWDEHLKTSTYTPSDNELLQFKEANDYLISEKERLKSQQDFQRKLEQVSSLIDENASLEDVEKCFASAEAFGQDIPDRIANRVAQYRLDTERERRTAAVLRGCRIIGVAAVVVIVVVGGGILTVQHMIERQQAANLISAVRAGDLKKARSLLADIEKKYPKLAARPKVSQARAELHNLEEQEANRIKEFNATIAELDKMLKNFDIDSNIKGKVASAKKLAKTEIERDLVREREVMAEEKLAQFTEKNEDKFLTQIASIRETNKNALDAIERGKKDGNFEPAKKLVEDVLQLCEKTREIPAIKEDLLTDYKGLLDSGKNLKQLLDAALNQRREIDDALKQIATANSLSALADAQKRLVAKASSSSELTVMCEKLKQDIATLQAILDFQTQRLNRESTENEKSGYFSDLRWLEEYKKRRIEAKKNLRESIDSLQQNTNKRRLFFIRFRAKDSSLIDIYGNRFIADNKEITMDRSDGAKVKISRVHQLCRLHIDDTDYGYCKLISPRSISEFSRSRAPHQVIIEKIFKQIPSVEDDKILEYGVKTLQDIYRNQYCAPYWKMQLSLRILQAIAPLDLSTDRTLPSLLEEIEKIKALDDGSSDPLYNKFLTEKIEVFLSHYDFKKLTNAVAANELLYKQRTKNSQRKYAYLGVMINANGQRKFSRAPNFSQSSGDVWCFDESGVGCLIVGRFDPNDIVITEKYLDYVKGRVLFTTSAGDNMLEELNALKQNKCGVNLGLITWPDFWPVNLRGDDK